MGNVCFLLLAVLVLFCLFGSSVSCSIVLHFVFVVLFDDITALMNWLVQDKTGFACLLAACCWFVLCFKFFDVYLRT